MSLSTSSSSSSSSSEEADYDITARVVLKQQGFESEDVNNRDRLGMTPLILFCCTDNLPMCRYLVFRRGANCRQTDQYGCTPLYTAAAFGHLEICQFLYLDGGAHEDIRTINNSGASPLLVALYNEHFEVAQWLIRNRALSLSSDDAGVIDVATMRRDLLPHRIFENWSYDRRLTVLSWAQDAVTNHDNVELFFKGTIIPAASFRRHPKNEYATRSKRIKLSSSSSSLLVMFKGKSGILELISKYTGNPKPQELRIFRQLLVRLPAFIEDVPFVDRTR